MTFMLLSVIINTYQRPGPLGRCLEALARQEGAEPFEVLIIDDGGQSPLGATVDDMRNHIDVRLVRIPHAGRAGARNEGAARARGERILFLGDDVMVQPGCLTRHRACQEPLAAIRGPYPMRDPGGSPPFRRWAEPNPQQEIKDPQNADFSFFATGNLSLDRQVFLNLGGFDTRFTFYGWEDIDLGLRFERADGRLIFDPQARAVHEHPPISRRQLWRREYEMGITAWQFWEKWSVVAPEVAAKMIFWDDPAALRPGPPWHRRLGEGLMGLLDRLAPNSGFNRRLYERMIFSHRLAGVAEGWRRSREETTR